MKPKESITININVDWRVLAILGIVLGFLVLAFSVVWAQEGDSPDTNTVQVETQETQHEKASETLPTLPALDCADGLLPTTNGECVQINLIDNEPSSITGGVGISTIGGGVRLFYLTSSSYSTNKVLTACASGYHMASLWEILDVTNLAYDYNHPDALTKADSGYGPPSSWFGWVRTGTDSGGSNTTGTGNCRNWSSVSSVDYGVSVRLSGTWETAPGDIFTWDANSFSCNFTGPVWCVGNFSTLYLPLTHK